MSTYLLLRNNKETGPFTIEEIRDLPLKAYDLLWVVGKSAAWRYPGEIAELRSFAPAVPEQPADPFLRTRSAENANADAVLNKKNEAPHFKIRESSTQISPARSVYVNLPAEKKQPGMPATRVINDSNLQPDPEPDYDFSELYNKKPSRAIRITGKLLWFCSILLLFGTGILTGFFISDRRKFFSSDANTPHIRQVNGSSGYTKGKEISPGGESIPGSPLNKEDMTSGDLSVKTIPAVAGKSISGAGKKNSKNASPKKDSLFIPAPSFSAPGSTDSSQTQNTFSKTESLYQKVKMHPENYVSLVLGKYTTGIFGGISSIPVTVTNNSPVMMDQIIVNVEYIQSNNKVFKSESISFNDLEPGETVTEKAPKSARGTKITTRIHLINSHKLDLNYSN